MPSFRFLRPLSLLVLLASAAVVPSCASKKISGPAKENARPTVQLTRAPSRTGDLYSYTYQMEWTGFDSDGEVREFIYAIDPPQPTSTVPEPDTAWNHTTSFGQSFHFEATEPLPGGTPPVAVDYHTFVLKAVDERGLASLPAVVNFTASTVAPTARIVSPVPSSRYKNYLPPNFWVTWEGFDLDGVESQKPIFYRVKLLNISSPVTPAQVAADIDTLIHYYAPRNWATWDSLGADVTTYQLTTLAPLQDFAFVVIAFDEAGAYTPIASGDVNVLQFRALYANAGGPIFTVSNDFMNFTYSSPGYFPNDPRYEIFVEVPANVPVTFNWTARAAEGTDIRYYRWVMDSENIEDNTRRTNEHTDITRWSQPNHTVKSATVGPFSTAGDHRFYIEAGDGNGLRSLAVVRFQVVVGTFDKELAICDDTRLSVDRRSPGATSCIDRPFGRFPTAAELDTFLYARGGIPIKCYPAGSISRQGLFWGYPYDTLNMRPGRTNQTPSLSLLSKYRHLVWLVNPAAIDNNDPGANINDGITTMRFMNTTGNLNVLAAYMRQGGELWMAGGGSVGASIMPFNASGNDRPSRTFSAAAGELRPGRFAYDFVHWRSEFKPASGVYQIRRNFGRFGTTPPPQYALFPERLQAKSLALGDTLVPWRTSTGDFFLSAFDLEVITAPLEILEDQNPDPEVADMVSTLDTLFTVSGGTLPAGSVLMTVYHGADNNRVIASGFDLWSYNKTQIRQVIDGVLQGIWGIPRNTAPPVTAASRPRAWAPTTDERAAAVSPARR